MGKAAASALQGWFPFRRHRRLRAITPRLLGIVVLAAAVEPTQAAVIFDNGGPAGTAIYSELSMMQFVADDFVLAAGQAVVRDVHWFGMYGDDDPNEPDAFTVQFFEDSYGVPADDPFASIAVGDVGRADTGMVVYGGLFRVFAYSAQIPAQSLDPGKVYWLSVYNHVLPDPPNWPYWAWVSAAGNASADAATRRLFGNSWSSYPAQMAFSLTSDLKIPEPGSLALLSLGLVGLGLGRGRKAN